MPELTDQEIYNRLLQGANDDYFQWKDQARDELRTIRGAPSTKGVETAIREHLRAGKKVTCAEQKGEYAGEILYEIRLLLGTLKLYVKIDLDEKYGDYIKLIVVRCHENWR